MHFLLQSDKGTIDKEIFDLRYVLSHYGNQYAHDVDDISENDIRCATFGNGINVPVGTLGFVGAFLENVKGSSYMKPLEIPEFLRKPEYLKRDYTIGKLKDLPKNGIYFIKDASHLKNWCADVYFMSNLKDTIPKVQDDWEKHDYVCSEVLSEIYSEYRVLVHEDNVVGVQYYSGHQKIRDDYTGYQCSYSSGVLSFPDSDVIKSILRDIKSFRLKGVIFPRSYTLDVAVTPRGTVLLEVHNFVSCGTYGFCGTELPKMYANGIEYELNYGG